MAAHNYSKMLRLVDPRYGKQKRNETGTAAHALDGGLEVLFLLRDVAGVHLEPPLQRNDKLQGRDRRRENKFERQVKGRRNSWSKKEMVSRKRVYFDRPGPPWRGPGPRARRQAVGVDADKVCERWEKLLS